MNLSRKWKLYYPIIQLVIAIAFLFLGACETSSRKKPTFSPQDIIKEFCIFKDSSYWIYRDSLTLEVDTQTVYDAKWILISSTPMSFKENSFSSFVKSSYYKNNIQYKTRVLNENSSVYEQSANGATLFSSNIKFNEKQFFMNNNYFLVENRLDSMSIGGIVYKDIFIVSTVSSLYAYNQYRIFWAKKIGIIKYLTHDGYVWELVKSKTNQ